MPNALHRHATSQVTRCFAMKTNFISHPHEVGPRPFSRISPSALVWAPHVAAIRTPAAPASSGERLCRTPSLICAARSHERSGPGRLALPIPALPDQFDRLLNSRLNLRLCMATSGCMKHPIPMPSAAHFATNNLRRSRLHYSGVEMTSNAAVPFAA